MIEIKKEIEKEIERDRDRDWEDSKAEKNEQIIIPPLFLIQINNKLLSNLIDTI